MLSNSIALIIGASYFGVEAYRTNGRIARIVLAVLSGLFVLAGVFLNALTSAYPKVGAFVSGIFDDPSSWFILLLGLFFVLRPFWQRTGPLSGLPAADAAAGSTDGELRKIVDAHSGILAMTIERVDRVQDAREADGEAVVKLTENLNRLDSATAARLSLMGDGVHAQIKNIYLSLEAIYDRERMRKLESQMAKAAARLVISDFSSPFDEKAWTQWRKDEEQWSQDLARWVERATKYLPNAPEEIYDTPPSAYRVGEWPPDSLFGGDSIKVHDYKTFVLRRKNFEQINGHVARRVNSAAFEGQAAQMRSGEEEK